MNLNFVDGVSMRSRHRDAVVMITRESRYPSIAGVKRGYAFGDDDVPRDADTEYLKVKYSAKNRAPPVSLCRRGGRCIEKILGAGSTPLEQFLIKRKLMGPAGSASTRRCSATRR